VPYPAEVGRPEETQRGGKKPQVPAAERYAESAWGRDIGVPIFLKGESAGPLKIKGSPDAGV